MTPWPPDVTLDGEHARLELLSPLHGAALAEAARDGELWKLWFTSVPAPEDMAGEIERRLALRDQGSMLPFAVIEAATGRPVGMTTYMNIDAANRRLEIGSTWYRATAQRTAINTECKLLLLGHAFEILECIAVEFRTHFFNHASRRAIERLGAKLDGVLRSHQVGRAGELRDTCVYSILASEWPAARRNLEWRLDDGIDAPQPDGAI
ncbi:MAG: GNAT family N-acetyltransferase [Caulobacteraceae bacterium]